jgi:hypothetical protein
MLQIVASLTDDSRCVIYERNTFIIQASVLALAPWVVQAGKGLLILIVYAQGIKVSIITFCYHPIFSSSWKIAFWATKNSCVNVPLDINRVRTRQRWGGFVEHLCWTWAAQESVTQSEWPGNWTNIRPIFGNVAKTVAKISNWNFKTSAPNCF